MSIFKKMPPQPKPIPEPDYARLPGIKWSPEMREDFAELINALVQRKSNSS